MTGMQGCVNQGRPIAEDIIGPLRDSTDSLGQPVELSRRLDEDGYLFLRGALDRDEVLAARAEVLGRLAEVGEVEDPPADGIFTGTSQRVEMVEDLGAFWKSVSEGPALRQVTHGERLRGVMSEVYGEPARPHDYLFLRPSPVGRATNLHYDRPFFARGSDRINTVWLALGDIPVAEGPLVVVEGSNRFDDLLEQAYAIDYDSSDSPLVTIPDDAVALARQRGTRLITAHFEVGDMAVFSMKIMHGTLDNHSQHNRIRLSCDVRFQPLADDMDERYFGPDPSGTTGAGYGELNGAKPLDVLWHTR